MSCPHGRWIGACDVCKPIHTSRDQAWHFRHPTLGYIDSKGEFDRRCKAKGLVRVASDELVTRGEPTKPPLPTRQEIGKLLDGVVHDVMAQSRNPVRVEQTWRKTHQRVRQPLSPVGVEYVQPKTEGQ